MSNKLMTKEKIPKPIRFDCLPGDPNKLMTQDDCKKECKYANKRENPIKCKAIERPTNKSIDLAVCITCTQNQDQTRPSNVENEEYIPMKGKCKLMKDGSKVETFEEKGTHLNANECKE